MSEFKMVQEEYSIMDSAHQRFYLQSGVIVSESSFSDGEYFWFQCSEPESFQYGQMDLVANMKPLRELNDRDRAETLQLITINKSVKDLQLAVLAFHPKEAGSLLVTYLGNLQYYDICLACTRKQLEKITPTNVSSLKVCGDKYRRTLQSPMVIQEVGTYEIVTY